MQNKCVMKNLKKRKIKNNGHFIQGDHTDTDERDEELLNEDKRQCLVVGDIDSIEGTINVLNFRTREIGMVFQMWAHE